MLVGVLGARARLSLGLVQPRVLDRQRGAIRQVLQQRAIVVGEGVVLAVARGGDRAHRPPARLERDREQAVDAKRLDLLGDQRRGPLRHLLRRDRGDQHRVPGVEHFSREALPAPHAKLAGHLSQVPLPIGIPIVDHRDLQPLAVGRGEGDRARIAHVGQDLASQGVQDGGDVEACRGEDPRRFRQHAQACRQSALALGEVRAVQRLCALVRDHPQEGDLRSLERVAIPEGEPEGADAHVVRHQRNGGPGAADQRTRRGGQLRVPLDQLFSRGHQHRLPGTNRVGHRQVGRQREAGPRPRGSRLVTAGVRDLQRLAVWRQQENDARIRVEGRLDLRDRLLGHGRGVDEGGQIRGQALQPIGPLDGPAAFGPDRLVHRCDASVTWRSAKGPVTQAQRRGKDNRLAAASAFS